MKSGRPSLLSLLHRKIIIQSFSRMDLLIMFHQVIIKVAANFSCIMKSMCLHRFFAGTIIDNKVCHPRNNDFYLCAHGGMIVSYLFCFVPIHWSLVLCLYHHMMFTWILLCRVRLDLHITMCCWMKLVSHLMNFKNLFIICPMCKYCINWILRSWPEFWTFKS